MGECHFGEEYDPEDEIVEKGLEHIEFLGYDATIYLVHHVHQEVGREDHRIHHHLICGLPCLIGGILLSERLRYQIVRLVEEHEGAEVHKRKNHDNLVQRLHNYVSPHFRNEDLRCSADALLFVCRVSIALFSDWLRAEGNGGQNIHDKVHP